ncbi:DUF2786 domain-containing protein [Serratia sp. JSRIV004]|uniref:DUF2786 domain-containing protein n=1 Tax=Serratia sp. JSRIV004 TaxID=2831895 RepID=UPI001CBDD28F|nr:DUF2786 domain-containing protein [Serratia sp. JSRIV004]UAN55468.1 DUF2786 domain-containing protein [Serratia sp. JSRIV004]UAN57281.1 DUF2786 domain-containing protein [Serratia sp. JSRIV004]
MNKEKYLAKIKKLLNLARKATNSNEAAAALRQAQNLMKQHGVSESEAEFIDISEASTKGSPSNAQTPPKYLGWLVEVINRAFGVQAMFDWRYGKYGTPHRVVTFYGPDSRPQIAAYAFDVLARQMTAARKNFIAKIHKNTKPATKIARADLFCEGWANGVYQIVAELAPTESETTLMAAYKQRQMDSGTMKTSAYREARECSRSNEASVAGFVAGRQAQLNHAVNGATNETKLIGGQHA